MRSLTGRGVQYTCSVVVRPAILPLSALRARVNLGAALLGALTALGTAAPVTINAQNSTDRIVAIGDIHGAGERLTTLLQQSGLIDGERRWTGGATTFVQTGDFTDRGPDVREVMDLLMRVEEVSQESGGQVRVLLGNHETMNLTANVRDATDVIFASFASDEAEQLRDEAYQTYVEQASRRRKTLGRPVPDLLPRDEWMRTHPVGFLEYMDAMGPDGYYGQWLRRKPIATVVGDTVFLHGGLAPTLEAGSIEAIIDQARKELALFDRYRDHLVEQDIILPFSTFQEIFTAVALELNAWINRLAPGPPAPDRPPPALSPEEREHLAILIDLQTINGWSIVDPAGPLWFRGFARWSEEEGNEAIGGVLKRFGVKRAVVGHSVTADRRVDRRFGGRVFLIDTGMLEGAYRGRASAVEFLDGRVTAIYPGERIPFDVGTPSVK